MKEYTENVCDNDVTVSEINGDFSRNFLTDSAFDDNWNCVMPDDLKKLESWCCPAEKGDCRYP